MSKRVVLIKHTSGPNDDLVSARLSELGYELEWRRPYAGDELGGPGDDLAASFLYGGPDPADHRDWHTDRHPFIAAESRWVEACLAQDIPTVGFCLGGGILSHVLGGAIAPHPDGWREFGYYPLTPTDAGRSVIPDGLVMPEAHYHGFEVPAGAEHLASSELYPVQAYRYGPKAYAFQFHPEVSEAGFRRWQDAPWAPWGEPGVQSREEQDRLGAAHRGAQEDWLFDFLDEVLDQPASRQTARTSAV